MDNIIDKLERGERPTKDELAEAGLCLECEGFGYIYLESNDPDEDDAKIKCKKCDGTGEAAHAAHEQ